MSAQLGSTSDPVLLVPGAVEAMQADADDLQAQGRQLTQAATDVRARQVPGWLGDAAGGWDRRREELSSALDAVGDIYPLVGAVLRSHARTITWARGRAVVAVAAWRQAELIASSTASLGPLAPWVGQPAGGWYHPDAVALRTRAQAILAEARTEVESSAQHAATILDAFCDGLPDGRWHWGQFFAGVGDWAKQIATLVRKFNQIRHVVDPVGYLQDAHELHEGLRELTGLLARNPSEGVRELLDLQTLDDNPARWWGAAAPDVGLGAAAGAGGATRLLSGGARAGTRVADRVPHGLSTADQARMRRYDGLIARPGTPEHLRRMFQGTQFNLAQNHRFLANEVTITQASSPRRFRLDSYNPGSEVVSRKMTQFADVQPATARRYIDEVERKYSPRREDLRIGDTPANRAQLGHLDGVLGRPLRGRMVLEVPVQSRPITPEILAYAAERGVRIRDVTGRIYAP